MGIQAAVAGGLRVTVLGRSPETNGTSEGFVKTLKRDYARNVIVAETALILMPS